MDDFPTRIADLLENVATKVRSMTVDKVASALRWIAAGIIVGMLGFLVTVFLAIGLFRLLGELIGVEVAYAAFGGLFLLGGVLLWSRRKPTPHED
jgi:hypothetical protein